MVFMKFISFAAVKHWSTSEPKGAPVRTPCGAAAFPSRPSWREWYLTPSRVREGKTVRERRCISPSHKPGPEKSEVSNTSRPNDIKRFGDDLYLTCSFSLSHRLQSFFSLKINVCLYACYSIHSPHIWYARITPVQDDVLFTVDNHLAHQMCFILLG